LLATFQLFSIYPIVQQCTVNASLYDDGVEEVDNNTVITECEMIDNKEESAKSTPDSFSFSCAKHRLCFLMCFLFSQLMVELH